MIIQYPLIAGISSGLAVMGMLLNLYPTNKEKNKDHMIVVCIGCIMVGSVVMILTSTFPL